VCRSQARGAATQAEANRIAVLPIVPNRGLILDRNGVVLADNYSAYTLEITPSKLAASVEETIDALAQVIDIQPRDRKRFKRLQDDGKSFGVAADPHQATTRRSRASRRSDSAFPASRSRRACSATTRSARRRVT
jgi:cell division protein FtsI/penicillin-binding protein 2